jgi:hypothetical protein
MSKPVCAICGGVNGAEHDSQPHVFEPEASPLVELRQQIAALPPLHHYREAVLLLVDAAIAKEQGR